MAKKRVLLIGGHGAGDPGACAFGYKEADLVKEMASNVGARLLRDYDNVDVVLYNVQRDAYRDNANGVWQAGWSYDLIVEWHINAGRGTGFEHLQVAGGKATSFPTHSAQELSKYYRNRGVKTVSLYNPDVAKRCGTPYAYVELFFIDTKSDLDIYLKNESAIMDGQVNAIAKTLGLPKKAVAKPKPVPAKDVEAHVAGHGWLGAVPFGTVAGTTGKSLQLEAFKVYNGTFEFADVHIANEGWKQFKGKGTICGTVGKGLRAECIRIKMPGYEFQVHQAGFGWTSWTECDGFSTLGSVGQSLRLEAINIRKKK